MLNSTKDIFISPEIIVENNNDNSKLFDLWDSLKRSSAEVVQTNHAGLFEFVEHAFYFATIHEKVNATKLKGDLDWQCKEYKEKEEAEQDPPSPSQPQNTFTLDGGIYSGTWGENPWEEEKLIRDMAAFESLHSMQLEHRTEPWCGHILHKLTKAKKLAVVEPTTPSTIDTLQVEYPRSELIGFVYLLQPLDLNVPSGEVSIGIMLKKSARKKGFARQAVELVLNWVFNEVKFHRVQAVLLGPPVDADAMSFFIQMGFNHEGTRRRAVFDASTQEWLDATYLAMLDTEWLLHEHFKPAPKSLWDEMFQRHSREREELLWWEEKSRSSLRRTSSMETITGAVPEAPDAEEDWETYASDEEEKEIQSCGGAQEKADAEKKMEQDSDVDMEKGANDTSHTAIPEGVPTITNDLQPALPLGLDSVQHSLSYRYSRSETWLSDDESDFELMSDGGLDRAQGPPRSQSPESVSSESQWEVASWADSDDSLLSHGSSN